MSKSDISKTLESQLRSEGVDLEKMYVFLENLNSGKYDGLAGIIPETVPSMPNPSIVDRRGISSWKMPLDDAISCFASLGISIDPKKEGFVECGYVTFGERALEKIGILLYPKTAYGVLNGGSASSYADVKKNTALDPELFDHFRSIFDSLAKECSGKPKGITPAFINGDGSTGWSFLFLKLRMLLEHKKRYRDLTGHLPEFILPSFQMTSVLTDSDIANAFKAYVSDPSLLEISQELGCTAIEMFTETQTLMAAITHSSTGSPRRIFDKAWGKNDTGIAMPGGHGQNFEVLAPIYRKLLEKGVRFAWLGNIDNMGYTVDPVSLAIFALSGKDAAFEESWRTPMDVKGGILVCDSSGKFTCA
ncbi:MAG TPA: UTP--glucose-1-phosphate uridylyltransferase, partial [Treponemataceae bacterium]|nr:UTP--glucose-1-phosphate uridylyltransferase [Treponemataceae bacterium]